MSMLQVYKEREGMLCLKIAERQSTNIDLGKLPEMLALTRKRIYQEEMFIATGNAMYFYVL
jgi:hypothetical protein